MIVKRGDVVESEFGRGKVVAITRAWVVHEIENGSEVAVPRGMEPISVPADFPEEDVDATATAELEGEGQA